DEFGSVSFMPLSNAIPTSLFSFIKTKTAFKNLERSASLECTKTKTRDSFFIEKSLQQLKGK
ncbi:hypothetical protein, partial [Polaribacter sp.]|uniref:hypothetical protein n=1 Tax=Polaribacter sp. TaxID=1920175 RepID=UPI003EE8EC98